MSAVYKDILAKQQKQAEMEAAGKRQYEYDSDEDTEVSFGQKYLEQNVEVNALSISGRDLGAQGPCNGNGKDQEEGRRADFCRLRKTPHRRLLAPQGTGKVPRQSKRVHARPLINSAQKLTKTLAV